MLDQGRVCFMADWNPELYNRFRRYRAEPVEHILSRLALGADERIADLGCGSGEHTIELARRTARGMVRGVDRSPAMIEAARGLLAREAGELRRRVSFEAGEISGFRGHGEYTIVFSNAAFHWISDRRAAFAVCFDSLAPGGRIVVQVPANESETAKAELAGLAREQPWAAMLSGLERAFREDSPEDYAHMLRALSFEAVDCYHLTLRHPMDAPREVVEWYRATALRPFLEALPAERHAEFLDLYRRRLEHAYGTTGPMTFDFRRLFIWARRPRG